MNVRGEKMLQGIIEKVLLVVNANIGDANLTQEDLETNFRELGIDSIAFIQMVVDLEEAFECEIPDSKLLLSELDTVEKIVDLLYELYEEHTMMNG